MAMTRPCSAMSRVVRRFSPDQLAIALGIIRVPVLGSKREFDRCKSAERKQTGWFCLSWERRFCVFVSADVAKIILDTRTR